LVWEPPHAADRVVENVVAAFRTMCWPSQIVRIRDHYAVPERSRIPHLAFFM
jgi:hypothetical protein